MCVELFLESIQCLWMQPARQPWRLNIFVYLEKTSSIPATENTSFPTTHICLKGYLAQGSQILLPRKGQLGASFNQTFLSTLLYSPPKQRLILSFLLCSSCYFHYPLFSITLCCTKPIIKTLQRKTQTVLSQQSMGLSDLVKVICKSHQEITGCSSLLLPSSLLAEKQFYPLFYTFPRKWSYAGCVMRGPVIFYLSRH